MTCSTTTLNLSATGTPATVTYSWTGAGITSGATTATPTVNAAGTYTVTVTDPANGCTNTATATVTEDIVKPTVTATGGQITCTISSVSLVPTVAPAGGIFTYAWTGPNSFTSTQASPSVGDAGTFNLTVTNTANGCTATTTATVTKDTNLPGATATGGTITCATTSVQLQGSTTATGVTYAWTGPGGFTSAVQNPTVTTVGTYTLTVTKTGSTCTSQATAVIDQNIIKPIVTTTGGQLNCTVTSIDLTATGNPATVTYSWAGPGVVSGGTTNKPTVNKAGTYTVTVTDPATGCTNTGTVIVTEDIAKPANVSATGGVIACNTTTLQISAASSTAGVSYSWAGTGITAGGITDKPTVNAAGTYTVTITNPANGCTATDTAMVSKADCNFDLALKKTLAAGQATTVKVGDKVKFTITVINQGTVNATAIQVSDYVPSGMTFVAADNAAWTAGAIPTTTVATLAAGASTTVDITLTVDASFQGTSLVNKAEISGAKDGSGNAATDVDSKPDNNPANDAGGKEGTATDDSVNGNGTGTPGDTNAATDEDDADPALVSVGQSFDLALKKTLAAGQSPNVTAGGTVKFTIAVINQGTVDATSIAVTDYKPAGLTLNDANWTLGAGGLITLATPIATLAAGATTTRDITFTIDNGVTGSITNTAEISSAKDGAGNTPTDIDSTPDNDPTNDGTPKNDVVTENGKAGGDEDDHDIETITVNAPCDKPVLTANNPVCSGNTTYSVTFYSSISNVSASAGTVSGTSVTGIPVGTNIVLTATQSAGCVTTLTVVSPTNCTTPPVCKLPTLSVGQPICNGATYSVSYTVSGGSVAASAGTVGTNVISGIAVGTNIVVTATATGDTCKVKINVASPTNCDKPCENPSITLSGPTCSADGKTYSVNFTANAGAVVTTNAGVVGTSSITGIPAGTALTVTAKTTGCPDKVVNVPAPTNCFTPIFDLAIRKDLIGTGPYKPGNNVTFNVTVFNQGNVAAYNVEVTDYLPTGLTLNDATWTAAGANATKMIAGPIAPNSSVQVPITLKIDAGFTGTNLTNVVEITKADDDTNPSNTPPTDIDSTPGNKTPGEDDIDEEPIPFQPTPPTTPVFDLALTKKVVGSGPYKVGDLVTFEISVLNQGSVAAYSVQVSDRIPTGFVLQDAAWTQSGTNATQTIAGPIAVGGSVVKTITFKIDPAFTGTKIENIAEITKADDDTNPNNTPPTDKDSTPDNKVPGEDDQDKDVIELTPVVPPTTPVFDLAIVKKHTGATPYAVGDTVTFTLAVINQGTVPAYNVEVTDYIPTGLLLVDNTWTAAGTSATKTLAGPIAAGTTQLATIKLRIDPSFTGTSIKNVAEISKADNDTNPANTPPVDKDGTLDSNPNNNGPVKDDVTNEDNKANPTTNDLDSSDPDVIDVTPKQANCSKPVAVVPVTTICKGDIIPTLSVSVTAGSKAYWYTTQQGGTILASDTTKYKPTVAVSDTFYVEARINPTCVSERVPVILKVINCIDTIDLHLTKKVDMKQVKLGDVVTYTIKVWNESNKNATGVEVTDQLPAGLQYVSNTASRGTYILHNRLVDNRKHCS